MAPLLERNKLDRERGLQITALNKQSEFEIPETFHKQTPWSVASWWMYCLKEMKKTTHLTIPTQLKPAKQLLTKYEFASIMLGIRKAIGMGRYRPSLHWVVRNAKKLGIEKKGL